MSARRLLARMRRSPNGWSADDFARLYGGFGFSVREGANHTVYIHPKYPQLRATVARHGELATGYARHAVRTIDALLALQASEQEPQGDAQQ